MTHWLGKAFRRTREQTPTFSVLVVLAGLGWWGFATGWSAPKIFSLWSSPPSVEKAPAIEVIPPALPGAGGNAGPASLAGVRLRFPSGERLASAGLRVEKVEPRPMTQAVTANGVLDYDQNRLAHMSPRVPGNAWRVDKQVGDFVHKGDVLGIVEAVEVGRAKADFLLQAGLVNLRGKVVARMSPAVIPERTILEATTALEESRIRLANAQQALVNLGLPPPSAEDIADLSPDKLAARVRFSGLPESLIRTLDPVKTTANLLPLFAPFDGVVVGRDMVFGESVGTGTTHPHAQFVIADVRHLWVMLDVRLEDANRLELGQEVVFRADGLADEPARGNLQWISTEVDDKTRSVRARAEFANPQGRSRARTFGTAKIVIRQRPSVVAVPNVAVQTEQQERFLFVRVADLTFEARPVRVGLRQDGYTEIVSGANSGVEIVTIGSHLLKSEILKDRMVAE